MYIYMTYSLQSNIYINDFRENSYIVQNEKWRLNIDDLVQDCKITSALAIENPQSYPKPSVWDNCA